MQQASATRMVPNMPQVIPAPQLVMVAVACGFCGTAGAFFCTIPSDAPIGPAMLGMSSRIPMVVAKPQRMTEFKTPLPLVLALAVSPVTHPPKKYAERVLTIAQTATHMV